MFFTLSGFLITGILLDNLKRPNYFYAFYIRRAFRIFPLYYAFLILVFGGLAIYHGGRELATFRTKWGSPIWFFVYLANYISSAKGVLPPPAFLRPPWSLQIEEQFYLLYPCIVMLFRKKLGSALMVMTLVSPVWRILMFIYRPENLIVQYQGTLGRLDALALGGLAAFVLRNQQGPYLRRTINWLMPLALVIGATLYLSVGTTFSNPVTRTIGYSLNAVAFATFILWTVQRQNTDVTAILRLTPLRWLGNISYGVYLLHLQ